MTTSPKPATRGIVWVTRPQPQAQRTADALRERGFTPLLAPLLIEMPVPFTLPETLTDGVIFTSQAAPKYLATHTHLHSLPVYCVGERTAITAREAGFVHAQAIALDAEGLITAISAMPLAGKTLLYPAAEKPSRDIAAALKPYNITIQSFVVYRSDPVKALSAETLQQLPQLHSVLLYSPFTAQILMDLLPSPTQQLPCLSLSPAVAAKLPWPSRIAVEPTEAAMLQILDA